MVSFLNWRKVLGGMESSSHEQIPVSSRLADDRQLAVGLHKGWQNVVDFQRLVVICGQLPPAFQLTILIKVTNIGIDRKFIFIFFFQKGANTAWPVLPQLLFL